MKNHRLSHALISLVCLGATSFGQPWAGVISSARAVDWSTAGVLGGIPTNRTQCGSTIAPYSGPPTTINNAITACGSNQYVLLGAGTFNLTSGIVINKHSNVTLRGAGASQTQIVFSAADSCGGLSSGVCITSGDSNYYQQPNNTANWTAGYAAGATVITLDNHTNLKVGNPLILDQNSDSSDGGQIYICDSTASCASDGPSGSARAGRPQLQIVTVASCGTSTPGAVCTSNAITISPGLYMPNWRSSQNPGAWWGNSPLSGVGLENLSLDYGQHGTYGINLFNCSNCWIKGVRSVNPGGTHVTMWDSPRVTIRDSYFYGPGGGQQSYGIEPFPSSDSLFENNIFQKIAAAETINGPCSGCVVSYNFSINPDFTQSTNWQAQSLTFHSVIDHLLAEGNVGVGVYADVFHGTHHFNTLFRNRFDGFESNNGTTTDSHTNPIILYPYNRYWNIIGNVLGSTSKHTSYQMTSCSDPSQDTMIYINGVPNTFAPCVSDPVTPATLMRWANYDVVSAGTRFVSTEVPIGISQFANAVPASQSLPASFYLSSRPGWWPSSKAWPAIGPDVTGGNIANVAGHANTIPAQDCYSSKMGGPANGVGNPLTFDAATCYGAPVVPAAPTSLSAVVQ